MDYEEPSATLPPKFHAQFYLPREEQVDLTIREIKPVYFYWLDNVRPDSAWRSAAQNRFEWPTATVIRALNWGTAPLTLDQLGATARVGRLNPSDVEQVAPVVLYHSRAPESVDAYRFVFRPTHQMRLKIQVCKGESSNALGIQDSQRTCGRASSGHVDCASVAGRLVSPGTKRVYSIRQYAGQQDCTVLPCPQGREAERGVRWDGWKLASRDQPLAFRPARRAGAAVMVRPFAQAHGYLGVGRIFAGPAEITFRSPEEGSITVELRGHKLDGDLSLSQEFRIDVDGCNGAGAPPPGSGSPVTLKVRLREDSRLLEYSSQRSGMRLAIGYVPARKESFLGRAGFAVDNIRFLDQGPTRDPESTLAGAGVIRYAAYPSAQGVPLREGDFLSLDDLRQFQIHEIAPAEDRRSLRMHMGGVAGKISSGPKGGLRDRRLTFFNTLAQNLVASALLAILAWLVPTLIAARKLYRDLRSAAPVRSI